MDVPEAAREPVVPMLALVACNKCRRRRGAQLHATGSVEPIPEHGTCPHGKPLRKVWAPGHGPGSEPPEDSGYDRTPPV
ncbi:hypothetical protein BBK14_11150 [Parafrankia soli]|uniref:Uncharacterized protein n=1 Tax=Parafrankia soli TaxID=2599596 RepID=A0A1S1R8T4_9ACTN|nr:hypothetical protein BBK14_11150 [Parafrankia soli]